MAPNFCQIWTPRVDAVHHATQPVGTGDAEVELGKAAQERQMRFAPINVGGTVSSAAATAKTQETGDD
jgi:hypothetical protein